MLGCDIVVVKCVDEILPTPIDFMLIGSVILELLPFQMTMTIGICEVILLVLQLKLEDLREAEQAPHTNTVITFLK